MQANNAMDEQKKKKEKRKRKKKKEKGRGEEESNGNKDGTRNTERVLFSQVSKPACAGIRAKGIKRNNGKMAPQVVDVCCTAIFTA